MTPEERWLDALHDETEQPSDWTPDTRRMETAMVKRLARGGCPWPELAVIVLHARSETTLDPATFAARLGLTEGALRALEGSWSIR